jgi:hypothetical protein
MKWYEILPHSQKQHASLNVALRAWGISNVRGRGKKIEDGVYTIRTGDQDVYIVREDKMARYGNRTLRLIDAAKHMVKAIRDGKCGEWSAAIDEVFDLERAIGEVNRE